MFGTTLSRGNPLTSSKGEEYFWYYHAPGRNSRGKCMLSIRADLSAEFRVDSERTGEVVALWLGFASNLKTGDEDFDRKTFIDADDPAFCEALQNGGKLRGLFRRLIDNGAASVEFKDGWLSVTPTVLCSLLSDAQADSYLADLAELKRMLPNSLGQKPRKSSARQCADLFRYGCTASLIAGVLGAIVIAVQPAQLVHALDLLKAAGGYSLALFALLLVLISIFFHRSPYGYDAFLALISRGILGVPVCVFAAVYAFNIYADASPAQVLRLPVWERYTTHSRNSTNYHLRVPDWHASQQSFSVTVNYQTYSMAQPGESSLEMALHPGRLGYEWLDKYKIVP